VEQLDSPYNDVAFIKGLIAHLAQHYPIDAGRIYRVYDGVSDLDAAMLEPATIALHAVRRTGVRMGDACVLLGAGPIGLFTMQCALAHGAGAIAVVEPHAGRREIAKSLGATAVIDPINEDVAERVQALFGPVGPDIVFECAGISPTIQQSAELVRRGGTVAMIGLSPHTAEINPGTWLANEVRMIASLGYTADEFAYTMGLIQDGRLKPGPVHTSTASLSDLAAAFENLNGNPQEIKVLVSPK
ncbi:MAG: zinc-binding dehydrogenase, partial [Pseudomonadota bacterium]